MIYLTQEGCRLCEEWIFQQDNAAIHNASITKYWLKIKKKDFLTTVLQKICEYWLLQKFMKEVDSTQQFLNSKMSS